MHTQTFAEANDRFDWLRFKLSPEGRQKLETERQIEVRRGLPPKQRYPPEPLRRVQG